MARPFFDNPPKKRRSKTHRRRHAKTGRFMKSVRGPGGRKISRKAWRRSKFRRNPMARRLPARSASGRFVKRRHGRRRGRRRNPLMANPRRRRRRHFRRNPPFTARGIIGTAVNGLAGGAGVTVGKMLARQGVALAKVDANSYTGAAAQGAIGIVAALVVKRFLRGGVMSAVADGIVYGAFNGAFESVIRQLAPTVADKLLGDTYMLPGLAAYALPPALPPGAGGLHAYEAGMHPALAGAFN